LERLMHVLIRCSTRCDSVLYVVKGKAAKRYAKAASQYFLEKYGRVPTVRTATVDLPTAETLPSLPRINTGLCPGKVCPRYGGRMVHFRGSMRPLVSFIGEAPGEQEEKNGTTFCGRSGEVIEKIRARSGFKDSECNYLNILQCRPPANGDPTRVEAACCSLRLLSFLQKTKPKAVVFVGRISAGFFFPSFRLSDERSFDVNLMRTIDMGTMRFLHIRHPSYLLRRGGLDHKKNKELVEETIFTLNLLREQTLHRNHGIGKRTWSWLDQFPVLLKRELSEGKKIKALVV